MARLMIALALVASAYSLELLTAGQSGSWSETAADTFQLAQPAHHRHAYRKTFIGATTGGGLCAAPGDSHLEVAVTMSSSTNAQVDSKGNYAAISMRADAATGSLGYQCQISSEHGDNGIILKRDGKALNGACPRIDQSNGVMNRYSTGYNSQLKGPYEYLELCQIQERSKAASLFKKEMTYTMRMDLVEDTDLNTVTVTCSIDGVAKLFFTDPCPLEKGDFALDSKYQSTFEITDYTKMACDDVPAPSESSPSLADGLTLNGLGRTASYWVSKDLASSNSVVHRYAGGCNNGAYPYGASKHPGGSGLNREGGGRSNDAMNVAALSSGACVKDGFFEADVKFAGDFLGIANGYRKTDDGKIDENQRMGQAGIAMRVDPDNTGKTTDSYGYMCRITAKNGQVGAYRGRNGEPNVHYNSVGGAYLTGRYRCKQCTCKDNSNCDQFNVDSRGFIDQDAKHTLRLEVSTDGDGNPHVICKLNGTTVVDVIDKRSGRHNWFPTSARSPGPSDETKKCGDFGVVTSDSDVVEYIVKNYTGYVPPKPKQPDNCKMSCFLSKNGILQVLHRGHEHPKHRCFIDEEGDCSCECMH